MTHHSLRNTVHAIGSAATLTALTVGIPAMLIVLHGRPDEPATFRALGHVFAGGQLRPPAVVDLITLVAWVAWLVIATAVIVEIVAWTRGTPTPRLAGMTTIQPWVRNLVATATLLVGTFGAPPRVGATTTIPISTVVASTARAAVAPPSTTFSPPPATPTASVPAVPVVSAVPSCVVVRNDSLWALAERHLGNPMRWREIYALNRGGPQPDGHSLEDANLIQPGWTLQLPADATNTTPAAVPAPTPSTPVPPVPATSRTTRSLALPSELSSTTTAGANGAPVPPQESTPAAPASRPAPTVTIPTGTPPARPELQGPAPTASTSTVPRARTGPDTRVMHPSPDDVVTADHTTGLAIGATVAAGIITLLGALRLARRRRRDHEPIHTPRTQRVETALRRTTDDHTGRLDVALRAFAPAITGTTRVLAVRMLREQVEILLDTPPDDAPPGFVSTGDPRCWTTSPDATTNQLASQADGRAASVPALISIGQIDGNLVMVDLETAGLLTVDGDSEAVNGFVRHVALELATSTLADHLELLIVGDALFAPIGERHPRIRHLDLDDAIADLEAAHRDDGFPTLLVSSDTLTDETRARIKVAVAAGNPVGAMFPSPSQADWHAQLDGEMVRLAPLGLELAAFAVDADTAHEIDTLIADPDPVEALLDSFADEPDDAPDAETGQSGLVVGPFVEPPTELEIRVLGPVEVVGPAKPFDRHRYLELAVYLGLHPDGVSDERLKMVLWPEQAPATATFNTVVSTTRNRLGRDSLGEPHLVHYANADRRYRLGDHATSDVARFETRVAHARALDDAAAIAEYRTALDLVRGQPFAEVHGFEWAWSEGFVAHLEITVARAAHDLAELCLNDRDADGATWAATRGLLAAPGDEILYRDRMLACDLAGNIAGVESVMRELEHAVEGIEPWDRIHPETVALYQQLVRGRSSRSTIRARDHVRT